jgi:hypothetical protein
LLTEFGIKPPFIPESLVENLDKLKSNLFDNLEKPLTQYFEKESYTDNYEDLSEYNDMIAKEKAWIKEF